MNRTRVLLPIVAALALAGCAVPASVVDALEEVRIGVGMGGCAQTHTFAPYPVEAFEGMLPDGWTLQTADPAGRTTLFNLAASSCEDAVVATAAGGEPVGPFAEAWGYLFVTPPDGASENASGDLWPLGAVLSDASVHALYDSWGLSGIATVGDVEVAFTTLGPALSARTSARGGGESFDVVSGARYAEAPFHDGAFRVWIPADNEQGVAGSFLYAWPEGGTELGLGSGTLRYDGPLLNAPPAGPAVVHHVRGVHVTVVPLPELAG